MGFSGRERRIRLYYGEARFTVAKDRLRPFVVESRQASVTARDMRFPRPDLAPKLAL